MSERYVECAECFGTGEVVSGGVRYGGACDRCGGEGGYYLPKPKVAGNDILARRQEDRAAAGKSPRERS